MRIPVHSGTVTPVFSLEQVKVIERVSVPLFVIARRTGSKAFTPMPAFSPAATITS